MVQSHLSFVCILWHFKNTQHRSNVICIQGPNTSLCNLQPSKWRRQIISSSEYGSHPLDLKMCEDDIKSKDYICVCPARFNIRKFIFVINSWQIKHQVWRVNWLSYLYAKLISAALDKHYHSCLCSCSWIKYSEKQTIATLDNFCVVLIPFGYYYPNVRTLSFPSMHMPVVSTSNVLSGITRVTAKWRIYRIVTGWWSQLLIPISTSKMLDTNVDTRVNLQRKLKIKRWSWSLVTDK